MAYVLFVREFQGPYDPPGLARERAHDAFLSDEDRRRKENMENLKKMGIIK